MTIFITLLTVIIIYLVVVAGRGKGRLRSKRYEKKINNSPELPKALFKLDPSRENANPPRLGEDKMRFYPHTKIFGVLKRQTNK